MTMVGDPFGQLVLTLRNLVETDLALPGTWDPQYQTLLTNCAILDRRLRVLETPMAATPLTGGTDGRAVRVNDDGVSASNFDLYGDHPDAAFLRVAGNYFGPGSYPIVYGLQPGQCYYVGEQGVLQVEAPRDGWVILAGIALPNDLFQVKLQPLWKA